VGGVSFGFGLAGGDCGGLWFSLDVFLVGNGGYGSCWFVSLLFCFLLI